MTTPLPREITKQVTHPIIRLLRSKFGLWIIGLISFIESALLVPIITEPFMVAYILVNRSRALAAVVCTTVTSVAGGVASYYMAFFFSNLVLGYLSPATLEHFSALAEQVRSETFVLTILGAVTPIPYTLVGLATGFVKAELWIFIVASFLGRGFRYALVGYLTYRFGEQAMQYITQHLRLATLGIIVLVGLYIVFKVL